MLICLTPALLEFLPFFFCNAKIRLIFCVKKRLDKWQIIQKHNSSGHRYHVTITFSKYPAFPSGMKLDSGQPWQIKPTLTQLPWTCHWVRLQHIASQVEVSMLKPPNKSMADRKHCTKFPIQWVESKPVMQSNKRSLWQDAGVWLMRRVLEACSL